MTTPNCLIPGRDARIDWQSSVCVRAFHPPSYSPPLRSSVHLDRIVAIFPSLFSRWKKFFAKNPSRERGAGCPRVVPGYDGWWYRVIDGNWKFDWQVFDVVVVDFKLAARRRREMTGRV